MVTVTSSLLVLVSNGQDYMQALTRLRERKLHGAKNRGWVSYEFAPLQSTDTPNTVAFVSICIDDSLYQCFLFSGLLLTKATAGKVSQKRML